MKAIKKFLINYQGEEIFWEDEIIFIKQATTQY